MECRDGNCPPLNTESLHPLSCWDWLFGTLHVPARAPEKLRFGVEPEGHDEQTVTEAYVVPFQRAAALAMPRGQARSDAPSGLVEAYEVPAAAHFNPRNRA